MSTGYVDLPITTGNASYPDFTDFPPVGIEGIIYIDEGNADLYLWDGVAYELQGGGGGGGTWGSITGTLSDQTDLQAALDAKLDNPTSGVGFWSQMPSFPDQLNYFPKELDVFANVIGAGAGELVVSAGAGASYQLADKSTAGAGINSTEKANGVFFLNLGTTASTRIYAGYNSQSGNNLSFGEHEVIFGKRINIAELSDGTNTFTAYVGHIDVVTAAPGHGLFFRYTHSVNGGRWEYCSASGAGIVAADTGVAPTATVYQVLEIKVNRAATSATFYIDGTLVGTISTGIPTVGMISGANLIKTAGSAVGRGAYVDALYLATERLAVR